MLRVQHLQGKQTAKRIMLSCLTKKKTSFALDSACSMDVLRFADSNEDWRLHSRADSMMSHMVAQWTLSLLGFLQHQDWSLHHHTLRTHPSNPSYWLGTVLGTRPTHHSRDGPILSHPSHESRNGFSQTEIESCHFAAVNSSWASPCPWDKVQSFSVSVAGNAVHT